MLENRGPDLLKYSTFLDQLGTKRRGPSCTISRTPRFNQKVMSSAAAHLGPGQYKSCSSFTFGEHEEIRSGILTRSSSAPSFGFAIEDRYAEDGALKGNSPSRGNRVVNLVGPGAYSLPKVGGSTWLERAPAYSVPRTGRTKQKIKLS
eukprot:TRINITY_DN24884_c0_g1_i1.p1 TRINITY_DN24884_c0_g1~~TRINITY_DN24884_c0_g1_i1.p1  ORF type:complete len:173 (-),score=20.79 TRINITY_DN24884_c0_g1_i1:456-899(-)